MVKKFEAGVIREPFTVGPDTTIGEVLKLTRARNISGVPVVDGAASWSASSPAATCASRRSSMIRSATS